MSQIRTNSIVPSGGIPGGATGGGIIQVVETSVSTQSSTSSTSYQDRISASITPRSSSNKILILVTSPVLTTSNSEIYCAILRNTTQIYGPTKNGGVASCWTMISLSCLDSPATTSSVTYKVQFRSSLGATVYFGTGDVNSDNVNLTLLEISG